MAKWVTGKIRIIRMGTITVYFHWSYLFFPFGTLLWFGWMRGRVEGICIALVFLIMLAGSLLFHEYCHCLAARLCAVQKNFAIVLIPFGAVALIKNILRISPLKELAIALAGPLGSALLGCAVWGAWSGFRNKLLYLGEPGLYTAQVLYFMMMLNFWIAAFNAVLFVFPADGGRICRAILHGLLRRCSRLDADAAHLLSTKLTVRGGWIASLIIISLLIRYDVMISTMFILLPLLCIAGEVELFIIKDRDLLMDLEATQIWKECHENRYCSYDCPVDRRHGHSHCLEADFFQGKEIEKRKTQA